MSEIPGGFDPTRDSLHSSLGERELNPQALKDLVGKSSLEEADWKLFEAASQSDDMVMIFYTQKIAQELPPQEPPLQERQRQIKQMVEAKVKNYFDTLKNAPLEVLEAALPALQAAVETKIYRNIDDANEALKQIGIESANASVVEEVIRILGGEHEGDSSRIMKTILQESQNEQTQKTIANITIERATSQKENTNYCFNVLTEILSGLGPYGGKPSEASLKAAEKVRERIEELLNAEPIEESSLTMIIQLFRGTYFQSDDDKFEFQKLLYKNFKKIFDIVSDGDPVKQPERWLDFVSTLSSHMGMVMDPDTCEFEKSKVDSAIEQAIVAFGLDGKKILAHWKLSFSDAYQIKNGKTRENFFETIVESNFKIMKELVDVDPDCLPGLHNEFGISDFSRYTKEMLLTQWRERNNVDLPYGVMIMAREDHNRAFADFHYNASDDARKQLEPLGIGIRIIECEDKLEVFRYLRRFNKQYNEQSNNKIKFVLLHGHGEPENIELKKGNRQRHTLQKQDFQPVSQSGSVDLRPSERSFKRRVGQAVDTVSTFLEKDAPIVLFSCSTGADDGIAQAISTRVEQSTITAPKVPAAVKKVRISRDEGSNNLKIDVDYNEESARFSRGLAI